MSDMDDGRYNGPGSHHDHFFTSSEMIFIGVSLWRGLQWYKDVSRRLTPEEQARYEIDKDRWKAYLLWEEATPGAYEQRMAYVQAEQAEQAALDHAATVHGMRRFGTWVMWFIIFSIGVSNTDMLTPGSPSWFFHFLTPVVIWFVWTRIYRFVRDQIGRTLRQIALEQQQQQAAAPPGNTLPILWKDANPDLT